jgi:hydroxymethylglutaryl-CoA reductase
MATEEPSVVAAANYMAKLLKETSLVSQVQRGVLSGQVYLDVEWASFKVFWEERRIEWEETIKSFLVSMESRGGGYLSSSLREVKELGLVAWDIFIDPCDAQGANIMNTVLEALGDWLEGEGVEVILKILSNDLSLYPQKASFSLPLSRLAEFGYSEEVISRLVLIAKIGQVDPKRALTHNKGIMNGITALTLATGNDTRAQEAAAHAYASRSGMVRALSTYRLEGGNLLGELTVPLSLATVGGSTRYPSAQFAFKLLGVSHAGELREVAVSLGLAQNLAAMLALASEGIQKGHMALHRRREQGKGEK